VDSESFRVIQNHFESFRVISWPVSGFIFNEIK
jgi:hypothetical protein